MKNEKWKYENRNNSNHSIVDDLFYCLFFFFVLLIIQLKISDLPWAWIGPKINFDRCCKLYIFSQVNPAMLLCTEFYAEFITIYSDRYRLIMDGYCEYLCSSYFIIINNLIIVSFARNRNSRIDRRQLSYISCIFECFGLLLNPIIFCHERSHQVHIYLYKQI